MGGRRFGRVVIAALCHAIARLCPLALTIQVSNMRYNILSSLVTIQHCMASELARPLTISASNSRLIVREQCNLTHLQAQFSLYVHKSSLNPLQHQLLTAWGTCVGLVINHLTMSITEWRRIRIIDTWENCAYHISIGRIQNWTGDPTWVWRVSNEVGKCISQWRI